MKTKSNSTIADPNYSAEVEKICPPREPRRGTDLEFDLYRSGYIPRVVLPPYFEQIIAFWKSRILFLVICSPFRRLRIDTDQFAISPTRVWR